MHISIAYIMYWNWSWFCVLVDVMPQVIDILFDEEIIGGMSSS